MSKWVPTFKTAGRRSPELLVEPGLRFDWDEIIRRPYFSPRLATAWTPADGREATKLSAGIGLYYEHTQLEYLDARPRRNPLRHLLRRRRRDTHHPPLLTTFTANDGSLHQPAPSTGASDRDKLPAFHLCHRKPYSQKRATNLFTYVNQSGPAALSGNYLLTNNLEDHYTLEEFDARHTFAHGYTLFVSYTHSSAHTNAALDYIPTISLLGPQQSGPLAWDTPNRIISWGWLPVRLAIVRKSWDFVYMLDWHTGFPYTSVNANYFVVGAAVVARFPDYSNFSPGLEWRFTSAALTSVFAASWRTSPAGEYTVVYNNIDSPQYGTSTQPLGGPSPPASASSIQSSIVLPRTEN